MRTSRHTREGDFASRLFASVLPVLGTLSAMLVLATGGCPGNESDTPDNSSPFSNGISVVAGMNEEDPDSDTVTDPGTDDGDGDGTNPDPSDPPIVDGSDGFVATFQDTPVTILLSAPNPEGPPITFQVVTPSLHGQLSEIAVMSDRTGAITFTPGAGFVGPTRFTYRVMGDATVTSIDITVYPLIQFTFSPPEGQRDLVVNVTAHTIGGYPLPDGTYTWTIDGTAESGPVSTHATRTRTLTSAGSHTIALAVLFAGLGAPARCSADAGLPTEHGQAVAQVWPRISGTVRNSSGQPLQNIVIVCSGRGTSSLTDVNGRFQVAVPVNWSGTVTPSPLGHTFDPPNRTYTTVRDDLESQDFQSMASSGNQQPIANGQSVATNEDQLRSVTLTGSDPEGAALRYVITALPGNGALRDDGNGQTIQANQIPYSLVNSGNRASYVPNSNFNGAASFQFAVNDGSNTPNAQSAPATVSITVTPVNDAPTAQAQTVSVQPNTPTSIHLQGSDVDGDLLAYSIVSNPQHGTLSGSGADRTYTPTNGYQGQDAFTFRVTDPSNASAQATVTLNVSPFQPPIGIPSPSFGIVEAHTMYTGQNFAFSTGTAPYPNAGNGPYTHYVDNTHPQSGDSGNPYGTPSQPRRSIPGNLPAGSVVEVHGGPYAYGGGYIEMNGHGSAAQPIFIRGVGNPRFNQKISVYGAGNYNSYYMIFEGLDLYKWEAIGPAHHIVLRNSEVRNGGAIGMGGTSANPISDVMVRNTVVHDNGDWQADFDQDIHGISVGGHSSNIWILDCEFYHNSGDGVQINAGGASTQASTHHIYVGRNLAWENKQTGFWTKQAVDVIFSQNTVRNHRPIGSSPSAWGAGMGYQYGPERVWFLYNHIYDCCYGFQTNSTSGLGNGTESFFIGNLIHDIHFDPAYGSNPNTAWSNAGMTLVGTPNKYLINNTIYNCDAGINIPGSVGLFIENNIIANVTLGNAQHLFVEDTSNLQQKSIERNVFYQAGGAARFRWTNPVYNLAQFRSATGTAATCVEGNPLFVNPASDDFHLNVGSPAIDLGGAAHQVYTQFQQRYGLSIAVDFDRAGRPSGAGFDAGAFER